MSLAALHRARGMTTLLAWRNLRHDPVRFAATLVGIVFSVTLMTIQAGMLSGFAETASGLIDHADAEIWIASRGTTNVDQSVVMPQRDYYKALQVRASPRRPAPSCATSSGASRTAPRSS